MRAWHVLVVTLLACGYLGYRVAALSNQVDVLAHRLGEAQGDGDDTSATIVPLPELASADEEHDRRLDDLETDLKELRTDVDALADETERKADLADVDRSASPDRILSVVGQEVARIRDRQIEFHRERWMDARGHAADEFADAHGLDDHQLQEIRRLLTTEVDDMIRVLKDPDAVADPEQAASDFSAVLDETDRLAARVLSPEQIEAWDRQREAERKLLLPWAQEPE